MASSLAASVRDATFTGLKERVERPTAAPVPAGNGIIAAIVLTSHQGANHDLATRL